MFSQFFSCHFDCFTSIKITLHFIYYRSCCTCLISIILKHVKLFYLKKQLTLGLLGETQKPIAASVDQDQIAQNVIYSVREGAINPTMFSTLSNTEIIIFVTFNLSSAAAFYLVWFKNFVVWDRIKRRSVVAVLS